MLDPEVQSFEFDPKSRRKVSCAQELLHGASLSLKNLWPVRVFARRATLGTKGRDLCRERSYSADLTTPEPTVSTMTYPAMTYPASRVLNRSPSSCRTAPARTRAALKAPQWCHFRRLSPGRVDRLIRRGKLEQKVRYLVARIKGGVAAIRLGQDFAAKLAILVKMRNRIVHLQSLGQPAKAGPVLNTRAPTTRDGRPASNVAVV